MCTWATLAGLSLTGRIALPVAATAAVAVQTALAALSQVVINGAALFHTSLYLADMRAFLGLAHERAPKRGELTIPERVDEIRIAETVHCYPGKEDPAVAGISLTLRRCREGRAPSRVHHAGRRGPRLQRRASLPAAHRRRTLVARRTCAACRRGTGS